MSLHDDVLLILDEIEFSLNTDKYQPPKNLSR